jgi:hypothetical protein
MYKRVKNSHHQTQHLQYTTVTTWLLLWVAVAVRRDLGV